MIAAKDYERQLIAYIEAGQNPDWIAGKLNLSGITRRGHNIVAQAKLLGFEWTGRAWVKK